MAIFNKILSTNINYNIKWRTADFGLVILFSSYFLVKQGNIPIIDSSDFI